MLEFLKLFPDILDILAEYDDSEKGRLYEAMLKYAFFGEEPDFSGNERFIWRSLKNKVDMLSQKSDTYRENAKGSGRPKAEKQTEANESKKKQTKAIESKEKQTEAKTPDKDKEKDKDKENEYEKDNTRGKDVTRTREGTTIPDDNLIFDLTPEEMRKNAEMEERVSRLIKQCLSPWSDIKQMRVMEDVNRFGIEKVEAALIKSAEDTKGANSLPFYRTILASGGKPKPEARRLEGDYQHRNYTEADFRGMEVDLDSLEEGTK